MFAELDRQLLVVPVVLIGGADLAVGDTPGVLARWIAPWNSILTGFQGCYEVEAGATTPALTFEFRRGTTILTSVLCDTNATPTRISGLNIRLNAGETLNVNGTPFNTDNLFSGVFCMAEVQIVLNP